MSVRKPVVLGIDLGTSSMKCVAARVADGAILERTTRDYLWTVGSPVTDADYFDVLHDLIRDVQERFEIRAVAVSTQMYSLITSSGNVLGWNAAWASDPDRLRQIHRELPGTGAQPDPIFPVFKLADTASLLPYGLKAAVMKHLCGRLVVDPAEASATGLYDVQRMRWIDPLPVERIGHKDLPEVLPHDQVAGAVRTDLGFRDSFLVAPGLGDGVSASWRGSSTALTAANLGTSVAVRSIQSMPARSDLPYEETKNSREWVFRLDSERVVRGGISRAGFGVIERFRKAGYPLEAPESYADTGTSPLFLPWLEGIQWPVWDSRRHSELLRFKPEHGFREIADAVWLSIVYMVAWMIEHIATEGKCLVAGGGVMEKGFLEALSRCVTRTLLIPEKAEFFAAEGAALSAAASLGHEMPTCTHISRALHPSNERDAGFNEWMMIASRS